MHFRDHGRKKSRDFLSAKACLGKGVPAHLSPLPAKHLETQPTTSVPCIPEQSRQWGVGNDVIAPPNRNNKPVSDSVHNKRVSLTEGNKQA